MVDRGIGARRALLISLNSFVKTQDLQEDSSITTEMVYDLTTDDCLVSGEEAAPVLISNIEYAPDATVYSIQTEPDVGIIVDDVRVQLRAVF